MDAEELPEVSTLKSRCIPISRPTDPRGSSLCRVEAGVETVDLLLSVPGAVQAGDVDALLELRFLLRQRRNAESALRLFCELRRRLEQRHYIEFYRLRRWLEGNMVAEVIPGPGREPIVRPVLLAHFCIEAVRRACLCACLDGSVKASKPVLQFGFRDL